MNQISATLPVFYTKELPVDVSNIFPGGLVLCEEQAHGSFKVYRTRIKTNIHCFNKCLCHKQHCSAVFTWKFRCYNALHHLVNEKTSSHVDQLNTPL